jgi:hypothetical protein
MSPSRARKSRNASAQASGRQVGTLRNEHHAPSGPGTSWQGKHIIAALCGGILLGGLVGFGLGRSAVDESRAGMAASPQPVPVSVQTTPGLNTTVTPQIVLDGSQPSGARPIQPPLNPAASLLDAFGRPPSDPHYGHQHQ